MKGEHKIMSFSTQLRSIDDMTHETSSTLRERRARLLASAAELSGAAEVLCTRSPVLGADARADELARPLAQSLRVAALATVTTSNVSALQEELYGLRAELADRGGSIATISDVDLLRAKTIGLVRASVAAEEFARRRGRTCPRSPARPCSRAARQWADSCSAGITPVTESSTPKRVLTAPSTARKRLGST